MFLLHALTVFALPVAVDIDPPTVSSGSSTSSTTSFSFGRERSVSAPPVLNSASSSVHEEASLHSIALTPIPFAPQEPSSPTGPLAREIGGHWVDSSPVSSLSSSSFFGDHHSSSDPDPLPVSRSTSSSSSISPANARRLTRHDAGFWRVDSEGYIVPDDYTSDTASLSSFRSDSSPSRSRTIPARHDRNWWEERPVLSRDSTLSPSPPQIGGVDDATVVLGAARQQSRTRIVRPIPIAIPRAAPVAAVAQDIDASRSATSLLSRLARFRFFS